MFHKYIQNFNNLLNNSKKTLDILQAPKRCPVLTHHVTRFSRSGSKGWCWFEDHSTWFYSIFPPVRYHVGLYHVIRVSILSKLSRWPLWRFLHEAQILPFVESLQKFRCKQEQEFGRQQLQFDPKRWRDESNLKLMWVKLTCLTKGTVSRFRLPLRSIICKNFLMVISWTELQTSNIYKLLSESQIWVKYETVKRL